MLTAVVAVLGTLAGSLLTGILQHFSQRAQRSAAEATARRADGMLAVTDLAAALADHRRAMWLREDLRLMGEDWTQERTASHITRSAITGPLMRVRILLPALTPAAHSAVAAVYALRNAESDTALRAAREHAIRTADDLITAAGTALTA
ncbi:protein kilB [Streptomyces sp. NPDC057486]|uniref:protein kilB n=1 Tax=Streptomyces sp. NPDC057486 TaxID=3346145 RepID=UPI003694AF47